MRLCLGGCTEAAVAAEALEAIGKGVDRYLLLGEGSRFFDIVLQCGGGITLVIHVLKDATPVREVLFELQSRWRTWRIPQTRRTATDTSLGAPTVHHRCGRSRLLSSGLFQYRRSVPSSAWEPSQSLSWRNDSMAYQHLSSACFLAGMTSGALSALWPRLLRLTSGADEVITTLMGNSMTAACKRSTKPGYWPRSVSLSRRTSPRIPNWKPGTQRSIPPWPKSIGAPRPRTLA